MVKHLDFVRIIENDKWTRHEPESQSGILVLAFPNLSRAVPENQYLLLCFFSAVSTLKERTAQTLLSLFWLYCRILITTVMHVAVLRCTFLFKYIWIHKKPPSNIDDVKMLTSEVPSKRLFFLGIKICNWSHTHIHTNSRESLYKQQCVVHKELQPVRTSIVKTRLETARKKYTSKIHFRN